MARLRTPIIGCVTQGGKWDIPVPGKPGYYRCRYPETSGKTTTSGYSQSAVSAQGAAGGPAQNCGQAERVPSSSNGGAAPSHSEAGRCGPNEFSSAEMQSTDVRIEDTICHQQMVAHDYYQQMGREQAAANANYAAELTPQVISDAVENIQLRAPDAHLVSNALLPPSGGGVASAAARAVKLRRIKQENGHRNATSNSAPSPASNCGQEMEPQAALDTERNCLDQTIKNLPPAALEHEFTQNLLGVAELALDIGSAMQAEFKNLTPSLNRAADIGAEIASAWRYTVTGDIVIAVADDVYTLATGRDHETGERVSNARYAWTFLSVLAPELEPVAGFIKFAAVLLPLGKGSGRAAKAARSALDAIKKGSAECAELFACRDCKTGEALTSTVAHGKAVIAKLRDGWVGFGKGPRSRGNHRTTFFNHHPEVAPSTIVHHAAEKQIIEKRWPELFKPAALESIENMRGIPKGLNGEMHLSKIRTRWNRFYDRYAHVPPSEQEVLDFVKQIDDEFGHLFDPPIRSLP